MQNNPNPDNNSCCLCGRICTPPVPNHTLYGERFYRMEIEVPRLSRQVDVLPVTASGRTLTREAVACGTPVTVKGQLRSYNKMMDGKSRLILSVFARSIECNKHMGNDPNQITLVGYVCKLPVYRTTPFNREITDLLLAVNRTYDRSDYIPSIFWGQNARMAGKLQVGAKLCVQGRIQSREYDKDLGNGQTQRRRVYEVSVRQFTVLQGP